MESKVARTPGGDEEWTITITGGSDVFRFAIQMLGWQVEFMDAASKVLTGQRKRTGAKRFDEWAASMLGAERFEQLKPYFMRSGAA